MEILAGILALIAGLGGGAGFFVDRAARNAIADQLDSVDVLEVRIQASPNFKLIGGRIDRVILAGRGLELEPFPRVNVLELEADPVRVSLDGGDIELQSPLSAAVRVEITEADINASLRSPEVLERFQGLEADLPLVGEDGDTEVFDLEEPAVEFLGDNRVRLSGRLVEEEATAEEVLEIEFAAGIEIVEGQRVQLVDPEFELNDVPVAFELVEAFTDGLNRSLDASNLEEQGILLRLLELEVSSDTFEAIAFVRVESLEFIE